MNKPLGHSMLLFLSVIAAVLFACSKDKDRIMIEGTLMDAVQSIPVEGADVFLFGKKIQGGNYNPSPTVIASANTDNEGKFSINIQQLKASDFEIRVSKERYFSFTEPLTISEISAGKAYNPSYTLHPEGWLRIQVQNSFPFNTNDLISYRILSDNPVCMDCCNSDYIQGSGNTYNVVSSCRTKANTTATIIWNVHKGSGSTLDSALVSIPLFDTVFYHLKY